MRKHLQPKELLPTQKLRGSPERTPAFNSSRTRAETSKTRAEIAKLAQKTENSRGKSPITCLKTALKCVGKV